MAPSPTNLSSNPYAPPDISPAELLAEKGWLQGAIVGGVAYGADVILFTISLYFLILQLTSSNLRNRFTIVLLVFTCLIFILATLFMGSLARFTEMAFIENRNFPGGPNGYEQAMFSVAESELGNIAFVISNWLSDAMIVWRCAVIYRGCAVPLWVVMAFPGILFAASFTLGLLWLLQISSSSPFSEALGSINWTVPYLSCSLGLNVLITIAIIFRLFLFRRRVASALGNGYGTQYISLASIMVESAAVYSIFSLLFLIPFALNNYISTIFLQSLCQVQTGASLLIVFRIAKGNGWSTDTATKVMTTQRSGSFPMTPGRYRSTTTSRGTFIQDKATTLSTQISVTKEIDLEDSDRGFQPPKGRPGMI